MLSILAFPSVYNGLLSQIERGEITTLGITDSHLISTVRSNKFQSTVDENQ